MQPRHYGGESFSVVSSSTLLAVVSTLMLTIYLDTQLAVDVLSATAQGNIFVFSRLDRGRTTQPQEKLWSAHLEDRVMKPRRFKEKGD
jgi:hypothetical protein